MLLVGLAMVACGGGGSPQLTRAQYSRQVNAIGASTAKTLDRVFSNPTLQNPSSLKAAAEVIKQGAKAIDGAGSQLDKLDPPDDARAANARLAKGFHDLAAALNGFAADAERGDVARVKAFDEQAGANGLPAEKAIQAAIQALQRKGYGIGSG